MFSRFDLLVIGGGVLGTVVACLAAEQGRSVALLRRADDVAPQAETLRNQAWLQSGVLFTDATRYPANLAGRMRDFGRRLLRWANLPGPTETGLIRFADGAAGIESYFEASRQLRLGPASRAPIRGAELAALAGDFHEPETVAFRIPDAPFDEGHVLRAARERALAAGAQLRVVDVPVELRVRHGRVQGVCGGAEFLLAKETVLAAGVGNLRLLDQLGVAHGLVVHRTPLLVIPHAGHLGTPLLVDPGRMSVTRQPAVWAPPFGALVFGIKQKVVLGVDELEPRGVDEAEIHALYAGLPARIAEHRGGHRVTCGYELMRADGQPRVPKEDVIVQRVPGLDGLIVAQPGRATLTLDAAQRVIGLLGTHAPAEGEAPAPAELPGTHWEHPICMHYEQYYEHLDERGEA